MSINPHPGLPEFDYIRLETLAEASHFLAAHANEARPFMGGTDTFVRMRDGLWKDKYLVDVKHLPGMKDITFDPSTGLAIGASANMNKVAAHPAVREYYPLLAEAANSCASYQLRTRATLVGNICNASPAGDTLGACMLLEGVLTVHGQEGIRQEPLHSFFQGPGKTILTPGDIITSIQFPVPIPGTIGKYLKHGRNQASDLAIVGVTVVGYPDQSRNSGFRIRLALAAVAPVPLIVDTVETLLSERSIDENTIAGAASAAMDFCTPIDDVRGSARYRKLMVRNLSLKALTEVWEKLKGQLSN